MIAYIMLDLYFVLSQVLVVISDVYFIIAVVNKRKNNFIYFLILSNVLFGLHYFLLGAWTGMAITCVDSIYLIFMYVLENKHIKKYNVFSTVLTMVIIVIISLLTWDSWISLLPMFAMLIYLLTMIFENVIIVKLGTFGRLILNGIYLLLVKSYLGAGLVLIIVIFTIASFVRDYIALRKVNCS